MEQWLTEEQKKDVSWVVCLGNEDKFVNNSGTVRGKPRWLCGDSFFHFVHRLECVETLFVLIALSLCVCEDLYFVLVLVPTSLPYSLSSLTEIVGNFFLPFSTKFHQDLSTIMVID